MQVPIYDLIVSDEAHEGGSTPESLKIISELRRPTRDSGENSMVIFSTATYMKPLHKWGIKHKLSWSLQDNEHLRAENWDALICEHGFDDIKEALQRAGGSHADQRSRAVTYMRDSPLLKFIMLDIKLQENRSDDTTGQGFSMGALFAAANAGNNRHLNDLMDSMFGRGQYDRAGFE